MDKSMFVTRGIYLIILIELLFQSSVGVDQCNTYRCSNVLDPVCGRVRAGRVTDVRRYHNVCHFNKIRCRLANAVESIKRLSDEDCGIYKETHNSATYRRMNDFSIMGAMQVCNHTCPTYCVDTYDPVCAQVWNEHMNDSFNKLMINHCHVDLFSCSQARNVTITPVSMCYTLVAKQLQFMAHIAAMKSLGLIGDDGNDPERRAVARANTRVNQLNHR